MTKKTSNIEPGTGSNDSIMGIESINNDDIILNDLIESAYQLSITDKENPELVFILQELADKMSSHFNREHTILSVIDFPFYEEHKAKHSQLIMSVKLAIVELNDNKEHATERINKIKQELIDHIKEADQQISQFISGHEQAIEKALINDENNADLLNLLRFTQQQELNLLQQLYPYMNNKNIQWQTI